MAHPTGLSALLESHGALESHRALLYAEETKDPDDKNGLAALTKSLSLLAQKTDTSMTVKAKPGWPGRFDTEDKAAAVRKQHSRGRTSQKKAKEVKAMLIPAPPPVAPSVALSPVATVVVTPLPGTMTRKKHAKGPAPVVAMPILLTDGATAKKPRGKVAVVTGPSPAEPSSLAKKKRNKGFRPPPEPPSTPPPPLPPSPEDEEEAAEAALVSHRPPAAMPAERRSPRNEQFLENPFDLSVQDARRELFVNCVECSDDDDDDAAAAPPGLWRARNKTKDQPASEGASPKTTTTSSPPGDDKVLATRKKKTTTTTKMAILDADRNDKAGKRERPRSAGLLLSPGGSSGYSPSGSVASSRGSSPRPLSTGSATTPAYAKHVYTKRKASNNRTSPPRPPSLARASSLDHAGSVSPPFMASITPLEKPTPPAEHRVSWTDEKLNRPLSAPFGGGPSSRFFSDDGSGGGGDDSQVTAASSSAKKNKPKPNTTLLATTEESLQRALLLSPEKQQAAADDFNGAVADWGPLLNHLASALGAANARLVAAEDLQKRSSAAKDKDPSSSSSTTTTTSRFSAVILKKATGGGGGGSSPSLMTLKERASERKVAVVTAWFDRVVASAEKKGASMDEAPLLGRVGRELGDYVRADERSNRSSTLVPLALEPDERTSNSAMGRIESFEVYGSSAQRADYKKQKRRKASSAAPSKSNNNYNYNNNKCPCSPSSAGARSGAFGGTGEAFMPLEDLCVFDERCDEIELTERLRSIFTANGFDADSAEVYGEERDSRSASSRAALLAGDPREARRAMKAREASEVLEELATVLERADRGHQQGGDPHHIINSASSSRNDDILTRLAIDVRCFALRGRCALWRTVCRRGSAFLGLSGLAPALTALGNALLKSQKALAALATYSVALRVKSAYAAALVASRDSYRGAPRAADAALIPTIFNLGMAQRALGRYAEARDSYNAALKVARRVGGRKGEAAAGAALHARASLVELTAGDDHDAIIIAFTKALKVRVAALGQGHAAVADTLWCRGRARHRSEDEEGALGDLEKALAIRHATLGPDHPALATCAFQLAQVYVATGQHRAAADHLDRASLIRAQAFGESHPAAGDAAIAAADVYAWLGLHAEAAHRYHLAYDAYREQHHSPFYRARARKALLHARYQSLLASLHSFFLRSKN